MGALVLVRPHPLSSRDECVVELAEGLTLAELVRAFFPDPATHRYVAAFVGGWRVPYERWERVRPKAGAIVRLGLTCFHGGGGSSKQMFALVATIAIAIFAPYAATAMGFQGAAASAVAAGITVAGALAVGALFKPPQITAGGGAANPVDAQTYSITGQQNAATPYQPVLRVYGRHRIFPRLAAVPYTANEGPNQFLYMLLDCGYGPLEVEALQIGDTPILGYRDVIYRVHQAWRVGDALELYRNDTTYAVYGVTLEQGVAAERTSAPGTTGLVFDFGLPRGLVTFGERGERFGREVEFNIEVRPAGSGEPWRGARIFPHYSSHPLTALVNYGTALCWGEDRFGGDPDFPMTARIGFRKGRTDVRVEGNPALVGDVIYFASQTYHTISNVSTAGDGYTRLYFSPGLDRDYIGGTVSTTLQSPLLRNTAHLAIADSTPSRILFSLTIDVPRGQWETRVTRTSAPAPDDRTQDELVWVSLRSVHDRPPIAVREPHTLIELKIRASEQLQGTVQNVNCICTSILPVWSASEDLGAPIGAADLNGDGITDVIWRKGDELFAQIMGAGGQVLTAIHLGAAPGKTLAAVGDFDGNGRAELVLRETVYATGALEMWFPAADGLSITAKTAVSAALSATQKIAGVGDTDGDGKADLIIRDPAPSTDRVWKMNGAAVVSNLQLRNPVEPVWFIAAVGDFNADGKADLFWRNTVSGENYLYFISGAEIIGEGYTRTVANENNFFVAGSGDFDGGIAGNDVLWRNTVDQLGYVYPLNGIEIQAHEGYIAGMAAFNGYALVGIGDFTGIGQRRECLWWHAASSTAKVGRITQTSPPGTWAIAEVATISVTGAWAERATRNPAWAYADVLRGPGAMRPLPDSRLDLEALAHWAEYCEALVPDGVGGEPEARVHFDHVVDYNTTSYKLLQSIAAAGRAAPSVRDSRHGVIIDEERTLPVQMFTPHNSWGFAARRTYLTEPHALRVGFIDPGNQWQEGQVTIYAEGRDATSASTFEDLKLFGVTRYTQATRDARYLKAQALLRREECDIQVDIENLIAARGDLVVVSHDVLRVGGVSSRITAVAGARITIADPFGALAPGRYGVRVRSADGTVHPPIEALPEAPATFVLSTVVEPAPQAGDLVAWGFLGIETGEYLVKQIAPGNELTAALTLVEIARGVYDADAGAIQPYKPPAGGRPSDGPGPRVENLRVLQNDRIIGREPYTDLVLAWDPATLGGYPLYRVGRIVDDGVTVQIAETANVQVQVEAGLRLLDPEALEPRAFVVVGVDAVRRLSEPAFLEYTPQDPRHVPGDVQYLSSNVHGTQTTLTWLAPIDPAVPGNAQVMYYEVRFQAIGSPAWGNALRCTELVPWNVTTVTFPTRNGAYLVKALTGSGVESEAAAITVVAVEDLLIQDLWKTIALAPEWDGVHDGTEIDATGRLALAKMADGTFPAVGVFYAGQQEIFNQLLQCRISSTLDANGADATAVMAQWTPLELAAPLGGASQGVDWDVSLWIAARITPPYVMADWLPLASAAPLDPIPPIDRVGDWRPLLHGEYAVRAMRFAIVLESRHPSITPRVPRADVHIDFPERAEEHADVLVPAAGLDFVFTRPFVFPPTLALSLQNAAAGDYIERGPATTAGFHLTVRGPGATTKEGLVDISAFGVGRLVTAPTRARYAGRELVF